MDDDHDGARPDGLARASSPVWPDAGYLVRWAGVYALTAASFLTGAVAFCAIARYPGYAAAMGVSSVTLLVSQRIWRAGGRAAARRWWRRSPLAHR